MAGAEKNKKPRVGGPRGGGRGGKKGKKTRAPGGGPPPPNRFPQNKKKNKEGTISTKKNFPRGGETPGETFSSKGPQHFSGEKKQKKTAGGKPGGGGGHALF